MAESFELDRPATRNAAVDVIAQDVECPNCDYNLRGLHGSIVTCPECGTRSDVARLISARWTMPWHRAPGFQTLLAPTMVATMGPMPLFVVWAMTIRINGAMSLPATLIAAVLVLALWGYLMWRALCVFESTRGMWLALLAHALMAGYVGSIYGGIALLVTGLFNVAATPAYGIIVLGLGGGLLIGGVRVCRRGERYIAGQCIRRYLDQQAVRETEGRAHP